MVSEQALTLTDRRGTHVSDASKVNVSVLEARLARVRALPRALPRVARWRCGGALALTVRADGPVSASMALQSAPPRRSDCRTTVVRRARVDKRCVALASESNGDGISSERAEQMRQSLGSWCDSASVSRTDDLSAVRIEAVASDFEGYGPMDRQRKVIKSLQNELSDLVFAIDEIHALTPAEAYEDNAAHQQP